MKELSNINFFNSLFKEIFVNCKIIKNLKFNVKIIKIEARI